MLLNYRKITIAMSIMAGVTLWLTDSVLDYLFNMNGESFLQVLVYEEPGHEFLLRVIASVLIICLGLTLSLLGSKAKENEARYAKLFENSQNGIVVAAPENGSKRLTLINVNRQACVLTGYSREDLLGLSLSEIIDPGNNSGFISLMENLSEDGIAAAELTLARKGGGELTVDINARKLMLRGKCSYFVVIRDMTEKKITEDQLKNSEKQLRILTARLMTAQEDERRRISVGLHDELGQALMHLKFRISSLVKRCEENRPGSGQDCDSVLSHMDEVIEYVRRLSRDLSPTVLEELGLTAALQYLMEEFSDHYKIGWKFIQLDEIDELFQPRTQVGIFRIIQEALTNVVRHSLATGMWITVRREDGKVFFSVEDNGIGFEVNQVSSAIGSYVGIGIPSMQERVRMIGGMLEIRSEKGMGTRLAFQVPVEVREADENSIAV